MPPDHDHYQRNIVILTVIIAVGLALIARQMLIIIGIPTPF